MPSDPNNPPNEATRPRLLNVGCGATFHQDWLNLDLVSTSPLVKACDLRRGVPVADGSCDAVYHSHVLEHLRPSDGAELVRECYRVLKPGGVLRVVVPDLEKIARDYLEDLSGVLAGARPFAYDLSVALMYDQTVRERSGGTLGDLMTSADGPDRTLIVDRLGDEAAAWRKGVSHRSPVQLARRAVAKLHRVLLRGLVGLCGGSGAMRALDEGLFRQSGEIHRWMYDRYSLGRLLRATGFVDVTVRAATESAIPQFSDYSLDVREGRIRKPDSLYVEAVKPASSNR